MKSLRFYVAFSILWLSQRLFGLHLFMHHFLVYHFCTWMMDLEKCTICKEEGL